MAMLRPGKKEVAILLSGELREWLVKCLSNAKGRPELVEPLVQPVDALIGCLGGNKDFHFICKKANNNTLQLSFAKESMDSQTGALKKETIVLPKVAVVMDKADVFEGIAASQGVRVQLEFKAIE